MATNTLPKMDAPAWSDFIAATVNNASMRTAKVGDADGNVQVVGRPNWVYARLGGADGERIEVHISVVASQLGDDIFVIQENPNRSAGYRQVFWLRGQNPAGRAPITGTI